MNQSYSQLIDMPQDQIFESIKSFILDMNNRNLSTSSMNGAIAALKKFYEMNDLELPWKKLQRFRGESTEEHEDRAYTKEEVQKLLNVSDLRLKATVLLACSTGMRIGAFKTLLKSHLEERGDCYKISVYKGLRGKGKYYTFCSPEARRALQDYFQFRERHGEKLGPDSPVFRKEFDTEIPGGARYNVEMIKHGLSRDIWKHLVKAGIREVDHGNKFNRKEIKMTHGFRKFYDTALVKADIHPYLITGFIGHSKKKLDQRYARLTGDEMFTEYQKAIPFLTIDKTNVLVKELEEVKEELSEIDLIKLRNKEDMRLLQQENKQYKNDVDEIKKQMQELNQRNPFISRSQVAYG